MHNKRKKTKLIFFMVLYPFSSWRRRKRFPQNTNL